jgi:fimbrial chaperone protein
VPLRRITQASCGLAALLALSPAVLAGTFTIAPLRVDFTGTNATAALTVRNDDAEAVVVQAEGALWAQQDGAEALTPSRDLLVSPVVFTLPPGGQQLVRVALRREADALRELSYRLTLQEVPQAAAPGFTGLRVALRLSVPVFVAPLAPAQPDVAWSLGREPDGRMTVIARNDGAAHARVHRFALKTSDGQQTLFEQPVVAYLLPGSSRRWTIDDDGHTGANAPSGALLMTGPFRLEGTTDRGGFATELTFPSE